MAQQIVGTIPNFNQYSDNFDTYAEILDQFFIVNNVEDDKKSAFLISCIGAETYTTLRDLCHPFLPKQKTFEELAELLRKQFSPQIAIFRERINFHDAKQLPGENIITFYGRLKKLSVDCKFGEHLESVLLDKFVTGLRPGQVLDRLCEENESLTLQQAVDIAINKECALKEVIGTNTYAYQPASPIYQSPAIYHSQPYDNSARGNRQGGNRGQRQRRNENWRSGAVEPAINENES